MPEIKLSNTAPSQLMVWHLTESVGQLKELLPVHIAGKASHFKSPMHQKQFLAKQILLNTYQLTDKLQYADSGKPFLSDNKYISISHSHAYVAIAVSQQAVGIDLEQPNPKLKKIAGRFVHADDILLNSKENLTSLQWLWTAKESIYKLAGIPGLSFKNDIRITTLDPDNFKGVALLNKRHPVDLFFNKITDDMLLCQAFYVG